MNNPDSDVEECDEGNDGVLQNDNDNAVEDGDEDLGEEPEVTKTRRRGQHVSHLQYLRYQLARRNKSKVCFLFFDF